MVGKVDRVHHEVGDRDVDRYADGDDGRDAEVAQRRVKGGATHRSDAVRPGQHHIGWRRTQFGQQRGARAAWGDVDTASDGEDLRVVVGAESVGPPVNEAVHDLHPGTPGRRQQPCDVGNRFTARLLGEDGQSRVRTDDRPLALLRDDRGVFGRRQLGEWDFHAER